MHDAVQSTLISVGVACYHSEKYGNKETRSLSWKNPGQLCWNQGSGDRLVWGYVEIRLMSNMHTSV